MKNIYCSICGVNVGTLVSGSKVMIGLVYTCPACAVSNKATYREKPTMPAFFDELFTNKYSQ